MCPVDDETVDLFNYLLFLRNLGGQLTEYRINGSHSTRYWQVTSSIHLQILIIVIIELASNANYIEQHLEI